MKNPFIILFLLIATCAGAQVVPQGFLRPHAYCGNSITKAHVAGLAAPVSKTVIYGTVSTTLFGGTKCAITQNLGADHHATAVGDATEASAGWYWQFNLKQGYKHDGATRTPSTTWITSISESSDWTAANDPCTLELGTGWRIPTENEWTTADGSWTSWTGPWDSDLKLHAAGYLNSSDCSLYVRGSGGYYWSSTQGSTTNGWNLGFNSGNSNMFIYVKADGYTLRCLKDLLPTLTTTVVTSISTTTASSGGNVTDPGGNAITARGVCWGTTTGPTVALTTKTTETGTTGEFTSNLTNLASNTTYYVRAYATNSVGTAYGNEVSFTSWSCNSSFSKSHNTGDVAPVTKTVIYGTVSTTLFGGETKCAITQNLGADHQASVVTDATEASAGWYWQFNLKQGYKLADDGTTRMPATAWITSISENSDWTAANDPCTLELGASWRIPTKNEWVSADGGWGNHADAYNSVLKLHDAGYLFIYDGTIRNRGYSGYYWTNTQTTPEGAYNLVFSSAESFVNTNSIKPFAFSIRCLKDLLPVLTTTAVTSISSTTASSGGIVTDDGGSTIIARGVCWGTTTGPTVALTTKTTETGTIGEFASNLTNLASGTLYYVRAYATNSAGTSYGNEVSFTSTVFVCGTSVNKAHVAGTVAPVTKTVNYGTVSTTLFGGTKCAITQNLGADHQATAVSDATEASAGWYWQFDRKQGYKHDGTTRTPNTTWLNSISETSAWVASNDPCTLELGTGWRIPTETEWTTADGSWTTWTDTWNSELKLHAAGYLNNNDGSLTFRGSGALYWSSTQNSTSYGWYLHFNSGTSYMNNFYKALGCTLRCLRD